MAGIITISDDNRWEVSNWVYWSLMDHTLSLMTADSDAAKYLEMCK
jgi:hypothetical protein